MDSPLDNTGFRDEREAMVTRQLRDRGIGDERVLAAMLKLPRHLFVPDEQQEQAYRDCALPIGFGQTISQPYMVAIMLESMKLTGQERVLDVGTGSGYQAALLGLLAREVYSVEIIPELTSRARATIQRLGLDNVTVVQGNGSIGLQEAAPFDAIVVAAGAPDVPRALTSQLAEGGTLLIPVGGDSWQELLRIRKRDGRLIREEVTACAFVPLVGEEGWGSRRGGFAWRV
jgi:protein-L-isoaspartate(D-aspartate) O-methyltransferase